MVLETLGRGLQSVSTNGESTWLGAHEASYTNLPHVVHLFSSNCCSKLEYFLVFAFIARKLMLITASTTITAKEKKLLV